MGGSPATRRFIACMRRRTKMNEEERIMRGGCGKKIYEVRSLGPLSDYLYN